MKKTAELQVGAALDYGMAMLESRGITESCANCEWMLASCMGIARLSLLSDRNMEVGEREYSRYIEMLRRKYEGEPLSYILGEHNFMGIMLNVGPGVFIPRPETEQLVEQVLRICPEKEKITAADIGTGSGCIAIALAVKMKNIGLLATDVSAAALECAGANTKKHGVSERIRLARISGVRGLDMRADIIVSNPPYVPGGQIKTLQRELHYEPFEALYGGSDGMDFIRRLAEESSGRLLPGGWLCMEVGIGQAGPSAHMIDKSGFWNKPEIIKDYSGVDRFVFARKNG